MNKKLKERLLIVCECGITVALALALCPLELDFAWLQGGGIDILMVPLVILALRRGAGWGIATGATFGILKYLLWSSGGYGIPSILLDYVLAYAAVGTAGFFKKGMWGTAVATGVRFIVHFISGVTIYAITASETVYGITTASPFIYSIVYNAPYVLANGIICAVIVALLEKPMSKIPKNFK
ncbi:MAG: energy-coupled thiamine transporter ThiT [Clostridia bacterium]|nr:energy-coupled thiamine transporter ThiT [Clostridia bacterium]